LDYVLRATALPPAAAGSSVTPDNVAGYVAELQRRVSTVTVHGSISKLCRSASILRPDLDWAWLQEITNNLALDMRPASKFHHIVESPSIVAAGLRFMRQAEEDNSLHPVRRAEHFRNGLMIALLACCPIRLRNFAALELGRHVLRVGSGWHIRLNAGETKEKRQDERLLPNFLCSYIEKYIATLRPVFTLEGPALWVGRNGSALKPNTVARIVTQTTRRLLGTPISPHLFRTCAASTAYGLAGDQPHLASALLNHRSTRITEDHYNRSKCMKFSRKFEAIVNDFGHTHYVKAT
jgi:integrase